MDADKLRAMQSPLKERYREAPAEALKTMVVEGVIDRDRVSCVVRTPRGPIEAGLHPAAGGDGSFACTGDMLLEALVGCAGVTLCAVATSMGIPVRDGLIRAEGDLDFRGTLGVSKEVDIGFKAIRMTIDLDSDASPEQLETLIKLTKRYCVIYQTLQKSPDMTTTLMQTERAKYP